MKHLTAQPTFNPVLTSQIDAIRQQIATIAARFVAVDGATYANAKQKAAQQVLGSTKFGSDFLPSNELIEEQVRQYNQLFHADTQPARLLHLRQLALTVMQELAQFNPHLTGAVLNGSAGEHAEIVLHLFVDNSKEVAIYLLNKKVDFDLSESAPEFGRKSDPVETYSYMRDNEGIHLVLFASDDLRRLSNKKSPRANPGALRKIIEESQTP